MIGHRATNDRGFFIEPMNVKVKVASFDVLEMFNEVICHIDHPVDGVTVITVPLHSFHKNEGYVDAAAVRKDDNGVWVYFKPTQQERAALTLNEDLLIVA